MLKPTKRQPLNEEEQAFLHKKARRKRRRIRFVISLFILALLGVWLFFSGWVHPALSPTQVATLTDSLAKTETALPFGAAAKSPPPFLWKVSGLIPWNLKINLFELAPRTFTYEKKGALPSGSVFAKYIQAGTVDDFRYHLRIRLTYTAVPEHILPLSKQKALTPAKTLPNFSAHLPIATRLRPQNSPAPHVDPFFGQIERKLDSEITAYFTERSSQPEFMKKLLWESQSIEDDLKNKLQNAHSEINLSEVALLETQIPDYHLYQALQKRVTHDLSQETEHLVAAQLKEKNDRQIQALSELGKVLSQYPSLLEYLRITAATDKPIQWVELLKREEE